MKTYLGKTIWIIGASSGIGYSLAKELSARGARLVLSARNGPALDALNAELDNRHQVMPLDVSDARAFGEAITSITHNNQPIDSVIYLAATYTPGRITDITHENAQTTIMINLLGALTLVRLIVPVLTRQGHGQIALCGSVAGYRGLPGGQPYSATKAAIINLTESLYAETKGTNIDVKLINPGFVKTPMTDKNDFAMPMMIAPERAAKSIARGLLSRRFEIHFPGKLTYAMKLLAMMPDGIYFKTVAAINRRRR